MPSVATHQLVGPTMRLQAWRDTVGGVTGPPAPVPPPLTHPRGSSERCCYALCLKYTATPIDSSNSGRCAMSLFSVPSFPPARCLTENFSIDIPSSQSMYIAHWPLSVHHLNFHSLLPMLCLSDELINMP